MWLRLQAGGARTFARALTMIGLTVGLMMIAVTPGGATAGPAPGLSAPVLLVLGDSLSAAYGMPLDQGWVALLQRRLADRGLPWRVVNASISGDTTDGGLTRLPALLAEHRPALVLLELGANDGLRGATPAAIGANLSRLIALARDAGAGVLLLGVPLPPNYGLAYTGRFQRIFAEVAARDDVPLVPNLLAGVAEVPALMQPDGLHPTASAQPRILEQVWPLLETLLEPPLESAPDPLPAGATS